MRNAVSSGIFPGDPFRTLAGGVGVGLLIKGGEIVKKVPEDQLLDTLREE